MGTVPSRWRVLADPLILPRRWDGCEQPTPDDVPGHGREARPALPWPGARTWHVAARSMAGCGGLCPASRPEAAIGVGVRHARARGRRSGAWSSQGRAARESEGDFLINVNRHGGLHSAEGVSDSVLDAPIPTSGPTRSGRRRSREAPGLPEEGCPARIVEKAASVPQEALRLAKGRKGRDGLRGLPAGILDLHEPSLGWTDTPKWEAGPDRGIAGTQRGPQVHRGAMTRPRA